MKGLRWHNYRKRYRRRICRCRRSGL